MIKLQIVHSGRDDIRSNLRNHLFAETGAHNKHILTVEQLASNITQPCLTQKDASGKAQWLFRVFGKEDGVDIQNLDRTQFEYDEVFLGTRYNPQTGSGLTNDRVHGCVEDLFVMYVPRVYNLPEFLFRLNRKVRRISDVLSATGWQEQLGDLTGNRDGTEGGVGAASPDDIILDDSIPESDLLELRFTSNGLISFYGTDLFWDSFGIQCSPYFRELTGFPEFLIFNDDDFGMEAATILVGTEYQFLNEYNQDAHEVFSTKSLYQTCEERLEMIVFSDIPIPSERRIYDLKPTRRHVLGHFDIKNHVNYTAVRHIDNFLISDDWTVEGESITSLQVFDSPQQTGHCFNVLPSTVPSLNFRALIRRREYDFTRNKYVEKEVPLLETDSDMLLLKLVFTVQQ